MIEPAATEQWEPAYATRARFMRASAIRELLAVLERPGVVSFAGGIPDPALFPRQQAAAAFAAVLGDAARAPLALQYSRSEGYAPLRQWIARYMQGLAVPCTEDNVLITSGSQQALEFLARLLLSPGDTALLTAPTYLGALQAFAAYEPRYDELAGEHGNRVLRRRRPRRRRTREACLCRAGLRQPDRGIAVAARARALARPRRRARCAGD